MADIKTLFIDPERLRFDYAIDPPDLASDDGLETAVIISLFTDRRAEEDDELPGADDDRRGWWGDAFPEVQGDRIGSRLWLLARNKQTQENLNRARDFARESLQWLVEDNVARAVNVDAEIPRPGVLGLAVEILRPQSPAARYRFESFWGTI